LLISGSKFFSDAAWKTKKAPGMASVTTTGIGVYGQFQDKTFAATVMIQASIPTTSSVFQAEADALLFAARIASIFNLQQQAFLTDNKVLAAAASSKSTKLQQVPWEIRSQIAEYSQLFKSSSVAIYHVKRELNEIAHNCAHQALRQALSQPIYSCTSSTYGNFNCPILSAVQRIQFPGLVIHAVNCL
jgi:hypothetical protein